MIYIEWPVVLSVSIYCILLFLLLNIQVLVMGLGYKLGGTREGKVPKYCNAMSVPLQLSLLLTMYCGFEHYECILQS